MALQGTLDTFALADVLRLLASTKKTGRFHLTGSRGSGTIYVDGGGVVATESTTGRPSGPPVEVVFELLRFGEGSFVFDPDRHAAEPGAPIDVEPLLADAERMLGEWREIEAVVPSLDASVALTPGIGHEVVVHPSVWQTVVAIGSGATVWTIGDALGLSEMSVSRAVKEVVDLGLAEVRLPEPEAPLAGSTDEPEAVALYEPPMAPVVFADAPPDEAEEVARQLASLSPRAARAVAAAARAETDEEREAALADMPEDEAPINRGLLLKFLSSVRT